MSKHRVSFAAVCSRVLALAAVLWGCGPEIKVQPLLPSERTFLEQQANFPHQIYRIEQGDTIQIRYTFHPDLKQEDTVRPDGKISANVVGELVVGGLTTTEVERTLVERTRHELKNPEVSVSIIRFSDKQVYVGGEVGRPGFIPYRRGMTALQAIMAAGSFLDTARIDSVIVIRDSGDPKGSISRKIDLQEVVTGGQQEPMQLAPHDVLFVPKTGIANARRLGSSAHPGAPSDSDSHAWPVTGGPADVRLDPPRARS